MTIQAVGCCCEVSNLSAAFDAQMISLLLTERGILANCLLQLLFTTREVTFCLLLALVVYVFSPRFLNVLCNLSLSLQKMGIHKWRKIVILPLNFCNVVVISFL